jgi:hypothetical protein
MLDASATKFQILCWCRKGVPSCYIFEFSKGLLQQLNIIRESTGSLVLPIWLNCWPILIWSLHNVIHNVLLTTWDIWTSLIWNRRKPVDPTISPLFCMSSIWQPHEWQPRYIRNSVDRLDVYILWPPLIAAGICPVGAIYCQCHRALGHKV